MNFLRGTMVVCASLVAATTLANGEAEHSVVCGDHWFKVTAIWTPGQKIGSAFFSGDSRPDRAEIKTTVSENTKPGFLNITFGDALGGSLEVDAEGYGTLQFSKGSTGSPIAPCYRTP